LAKFGTAINCIDGRVQELVLDYLRKYYSVDWVDVVTEPGVDKLLGMKKSNTERIEYIKKSVKISVEGHNSVVLAIVGHNDCKGNPSTKEEHIVQIQHAVKLIKSWKFPLEVVGLWVNEQWKVEAVV
jgi:hypothetical protein